VQRGEKKFPVKDFGEAMRWLLAEVQKSMSLQRYKGLGEMNPSQLWETTMDPTVRRLLRVQIDEAGDWIAAGQIMPMASRVKLTGELDLAAVDLALGRVRAGNTAVAVNLAAESVESEDFRRELLRRLRSASPAGRFALEVSEHGLLRHFAAVRSLREAMAGYGCGFGVEHVGRRFGEIARLQELGLDYLKVDASFIRGIDTNRENRAFLEGLASIARGMGAKVIAEGVQTSAELAALPSLGFEGATGPVVTSLMR